MSDTQIKRLEVLFIKAPLTKPYVLSWTTVRHLECTLVRTTFADGREGIGEAVPLPGYTDETTADIHAALDTLPGALAGASAEDAQALFHAHLTSVPSALSAATSSLENAQRRFSLSSPLRIPIVAAVSASPSPEDALASFHHLVEQGFTTIKIKIGRDISDDVQLASMLLDQLPTGINLRFDANRAYSFNEAVRFCRQLDHPRCQSVECLEQPFGINDWESFKALADERFPVPLMQDESIRTVEDIDLAAQNGASLVKLKLCKHTGIQGLLQMARRARELGLRVIMGNGVASDISSLCEAMAAASDDNLFFGALESNGFSKCYAPVLTHGPKVEAGHLVYSPPKPHLVWQLNDALEAKSIRAILRPHTA